MTNFDCEVKLKPLISNSPAYEQLQTQIKIAQIKNLIRQTKNPHLAPSGAKNEQAFAGVILKRERRSAPLYAHSVPHFSTFEHKNEALSLLMPSFHKARPLFSTLEHTKRGAESSKWKGSLEMK